MSVVPISADDATSWSTPIPDNASSKSGLRFHDGAFRKMSTLTAALVLAGVDDFEGVVTTGSAARTVAEATFGSVLTFEFLINVCWTTTAVPPNRSTIPAITSIL